MKRRIGKLRWLTENTIRFERMVYVRLKNNNWTLQVIDDNMKPEQMTLMKWRAVVAFYIYGPGREGDVLLDGGTATCGLCRARVGCEHCPVDQVTKRGCGGISPYFDYARAVDREDAEAALRAAIAELQFLRSIFPPTVRLELYQDIDGTWFELEVKDGDRTVLTFKELSVMEGVRIVSALDRSRRAQRILFTEDTVAFHIDTGRDYWSVEE